MKLVIAVVQDSDVDNILDALTDAGIGVTQINSAGGFLREPNVTLFVGVRERDVEKAIDIIDTNSRARRAFVNPLMPFAIAPDVNSGDDDSSSVRVGANVFVVHVRRFVRITG